MVAICIPWRPSPERERLLKVVQSYWSSKLPTDYYYADSPTEVFSRAQAINAAVKLAKDAGHRVVVISDADTMCNTDALLEAYAETLHDKTPRIPYDNYVLMTAADTEHFIATGEVGGPVYEGACSGVLVVHTDNFVGFNEEYVGWGCEDVDFMVRAKPLRVPGEAWALLHSPEPREEHTRANFARLRADFGI